MHCLVDTQQYKNHNLISCRENELTCKRKLFKRSYCTVMLLYTLKVLKCALIPIMS